MKPGNARSMSWMLGLALLVVAPACTTPRIPDDKPPVDTFIHFELSDDGAWLICIDPNPYLEPGSVFTVKNLSQQIWVGGNVQEDGSFGCLPFGVAPGDLIQITIQSPSGEATTLCFVFNTAVPTVDPYCGDPPT